MHLGITAIDITPQTSVPLEGYGDRTQRSQGTHDALQAYAWLVDNTCKDRSYGARPLRRAIQKHIEDALSERLIQRRFQGECQVEVDGTRLQLAPGDTFTTPIGSERTFSNTASKTCIIYITRRNNKPEAPEFI